MAAGWPETNTILHLSAFGVADLYGSKASEYLSEAAYSKLQVHK